MPKHVAIIPDGNRRWAKERGLRPWEGHDAGAKNIEVLVRYALKHGIECISFWGSSLENLSKRPLLEKQELLRVYETYFLKLINSSDIFENEVRINVIGKWQQQFPNSLKKILLDGIDKTKHHSKRNLNFFLAYSGDDEMIDAIKTIVDKYDSSDKIDADVIKRNLMTKDLPAVDYLIRTGGEPHLSVGFMMWDIANAQLYFSDKYFPDFDEEKFAKALEEYANRQRRHGK